MASTQLIRTPSSSSNRRTWTWSAWVKRGSLTDANQVLFQGIDGGFPEKLQFTASDILEYDHDIAGTDYTVYTGERRYRDVNGWMHIVFAKDTTQSTEADRIKIYVNGEQQSLSEYQLGFPPQNYEGAINKNVAHYIGGNNGGEYFNGSMSHVHFCDGSALAPTVFGETDTTTGEWKIKTSPSFTPGTNGFTVLKDGNTITDQSANSNNFTVSTGTLTKTEDSPSNVFATLNPLAESSNSNTLSQGNNTLSATAWRFRPSTLAPSSGKYYAEFKIISNPNVYTVFGVAPQQSWNKFYDETIGAGSSSEAESVGYGKSGSVIKGNSTVYSGSSYTTNDIIGVALDLDNYKVYFSKNGTWQNSGVPTSGSTGTGAVSLNSALSDWSISMSIFSTTASVNYGNGYFGTTAVSSAGTNASGNGIFEYDVPTGYTALSTKGLNL